MPPSSLREWARRLRNGDINYSGAITVLPTDLEMLADSWQADLDNAKEHIEALESDQEEMAGGGY